jgi:hypothetical protein
MHPNEIRVFSKDSDFTKKFTPEDKVLAELTTEAEFLGTPHKAALGTQWLRQRSEFS